MPTDSKEILDELYPEENETIKYGQLLSVVLIIDCLVIWSLMYTAKDLPYDNNYGNLLAAMLVSVFSCIVLVLLAFWKPKLMKMNLYGILIFVISSSPISAFFVMLFYEFIFGKALEI